MKNTLSITANCICACVDSIADDTNRIFIAYDVPNVANPKFKLWKNGTLQTETELATGKINYVEIPEALFTANAAITFQYVDNTYTGEVFTINFPASVDGSLLVNKESDYVFNAKYTKQGGGGSITVDSELSLTSENPVQNKVITTELKRLEGLIGTGILSVSTEYSLYFENVYESVTDR